MVRRLRTLLLLGLFPGLLTGCWDIKDLQEVNYLTAIGYDLEEGEFVIYGQLLDFSSVAKTEAGKAGLIPVWVGKGRGKTLIDAIDDLYRTAQLRIFYGHVNAVVIGEKVLKDKQAMNQVEQFHGRFHELRFTPWIFGASQPIGDILSATSIFDLSPGVSILHQPLETYKQRSAIHPISIRRFALETNEPSRTTLLPIIGLSDRNWNKGRKPQDLLAINGAFAMREEKVLGSFVTKDLVGLTWIEPAANRGPLVLSEGEKILAALSLEQPKIEIHPQVRDGKATYVLNVSLTGTVTMLLAPLSEAELQREAIKLVREQIRELYEEGLKHDADLLNLETALYRKKNRQWKTLRDRGGLGLTPESLTEIDVSVNIKRTGNMKKQTVFK